MFDTVIQVNLTVMLVLGKIYKISIKILMNIANDFSYNVPQCEWQPSDNFLREDDWSLAHILISHSISRSFDIITDTFKVQL